MAARLCVKEYSLHRERKQRPSTGCSGSETTRLPPGGASCTRCRQSLSARRRLLRHLQQGQRGCRVGYAGVEVSHGCAGVTCDMGVVMSHV